MDLRKLKTLVDLVSESNISELEITEADGKVRIVKADVSAVRPGADDLYRARLLPGDYYAVAMSDVEPGAWSDRDFLAQARERATTFSIADGENKTLDLRVTPAPPM